MDDTHPVSRTFTLSYGKDLSIGFVLAVIICGIVNLLPRQYAIDFFAAFLALTATGYFGSALTDGKPKNFAIESVASLAVFVTALAGLWHSTLWLAFGFFAHGVWDIFHHPHRFGARVTMLWFPPLCLMYDWSVALYILLWLS